MASTSPAVPTNEEDDKVWEVIDNDSQLEGHAPAAAAADTPPAEPEPEVAEPFATAPQPKRARTSSSPVELQPEAQQQQRGVLQVTSTDPLVYEMEESSNPEHRGFRGVAEPSPGDMLWMTSEDEHKKWWRACNPDFAAALSDQMERGVALAKFVFYPHSGRASAKWKRTYTHDLENMVQLDEDYQRQCSLRLVNIVANNPASTPSASRAGRS